MFDLKKKKCQIIQLNLLDFARAFLEFARAPVIQGGGSKFGINTGTLSDFKESILNQSDEFAKSSKFS
jgi:hypothetical protein